MKQVTEMPGGRLMTKIDHGELIQAIALWLEKEHGMLSDFRDPRVWVSSGSEYEFHWSEEK